MNEIVKELFHLAAKTVTTAIEGLRHIAEFAWNQFELADPQAAHSLEPFLSWADKAL